MWSLETTAAGLNWYAALDWVALRNTTLHCGFSDWRLPNAREVAGYSDRFPEMPGQARPRIRIGRHAQHVAVPTAEIELLRSTTTHVHRFDSDPDFGGFPETASAEQLRSTEGGDGGSCACIAISPTALETSAAMSPRAVRLYDRVPMVRDLIV